LSYATKQKPAFTKQQLKIYNQSTIFPNVQAQSSQIRKKMLTNLTSSGFVQFNHLSFLSSSLVSSSSTLIVCLSCASLSKGRLLFKPGVVGELAAWLLVLPTK
jgi:hypothetical protein